MKIIFCDSMIKNKKVDLEYEIEFNVAEFYGFDVKLINFKELDNGQVSGLENKECLNSFYNEIKNQYLIN